MNNFLCCADCLLDLTNELRDQEVFMDEPKQLLNLSLLVFLVYSLS